MTDCHRRFNPRRGSWTLWSAAIGFATVGLAAAEEWSSETSCDLEKYYKGIEPVVGSASRDQLQELLEATHQRRLPYTDRDSDDVWKALQDLDRGNSPDTVRLIYSNKDVPSEPKGTPATWNREHVWPKSHGVGYTGKDFTDVHHLFPADWGINSIRNNRYFNECGDNNACRIPTELEGTSDPALFDVGIFQPPSVVRGDVARALFYMDLRYPHLELTDCPITEDTNDDKAESYQMAYLSTLLEWHKLDPPTEAEKFRNDRACFRWQGNRNPFVDHPDLVSSIYGSSSDRMFNCGGINGGMETVELHAGSGTGVQNAKKEPTTMPPGPGDVLVVGVHSDNPDLLALVALVDLPAGFRVHVTDNAYNGNSFASNEGTTTLTIPETLKAGTIFGYGDGVLHGSSWVAEKGGRGFRLSSSGDTIIVYSSGTTATVESADTNERTFLSAVSFAGGNFAEQTCGAPGEQSCGTKSSVLPESIAEFAVVLEKKDNYVYTGPTNDTKASMQEHLVNAKNWRGSNSKKDVSIAPLLTANPDGLVVS
mmetsp:Transcript_18905/g.38826  ORF Transcript_18905/g.38826 Transcript_18905/m.38826 type:complete len:538 (+) Transcript_18905:115-1728(+)|eukprot:CAMPEP_0201120822 /NCGR_PEP_ID=MMETSP0850-20130426/4823_1 /ASSEMBLY_ACC=CAM_ASM_000622 /TAXON_ID=183588 /ORGANISM="Pseudo-nitzschia fraudulenta, Strain WWA7" /LENGTH=537 /DNA_ID=CAMNT_0047387095 /DNA_START=20 /DNA_END=1633 /DNA_ORIENTATION=+